MYPSTRERPSAIFLSAYSVITIEPSISIPIPSNSPIITRKLTSISRVYKIKYVIKKQNGIERPTSIETLVPILAITRTIIRTTAAIILPLSSLTIKFAYMVSSLETTIFKLLGRVFSKPYSMSLIAFEASIAFALSLREISNVTASSPLTLA